jgi:hypothetical protein
LGRHNLHGFREHPKKSLLSIRLAMSVTGARLPAFAPTGVRKAFRRALEGARLFDEKSHKTELCRRLTN